MGQGKHDRQACRDMDAADPLGRFRDLFQASNSDTIFLDANSIGAMPKTVPPRMQTFFDEAWVELRRRSWSQLDWLDKPFQIGADIAHLMGANREDVIACDNTTINLFKLLSYAWRVRDGGNLILSEQGNFPTDLYVAQGLSETMTGKPKLHLAKSRNELIDAIGADTAVVYLSHVDYRSGERWNMTDVNRRAHAAGALVVWDLSHSTGAVPVDLMGNDADFAVGCGYKYLCGGPGGSAYLWVHPRHAEKAWPTICGWMGHRDVFAFATEYEPHAGAYRHATGTPAVVANEIFACAAEIWRDVDAQALWDKHEALGDLMIALLEQECAPFGVTVNAPLDYNKRGGHIGLSHEGAGQVHEALMEAGVVGSFRRPNALRFGLAPLVLSYEEIWETVARLRRILMSESWRDEKFQKVSI